MLDRGVAGPDPVVDIDVGKSIANHVVKKGETIVSDVGSGIREDIMDDHHKKSMANDENKEILVIARAKRIGKKYKDKQAWDYQEEKRKKENNFPEQ